MALAYRIGVVDQPHGPAAARASGVALAALADRFALRPGAANGKRQVDVLEPLPLSGIRLGALEPIEQAE